MRKFFLHLSLVGANLFLFSIFFSILTIFISKNTTAYNEAGVSAETLVSVESYDSFTALPDVEEALHGEVVTGDARTALVENFFRKYHSPMVGVGGDIIKWADVHQIPFGLLPAIAQCEGNLGKVMPEGSFNTWGWAIYGEKVGKFNSWQEAIEKVSRGLRRDYFDKGLTTPETIMKKYTPSSNGSWADCVNQYLDELK